MRHALPIWAFCVLGSFASGAEATKAKPAKEPGLQTELVSRSKRDQEARQEMVKWMKDNSPNGVDINANLPPDQLKEFDKVAVKLKEIDGENLKWLKEVLATHGWPTVTLV